MNTWYAIEHFTHERQAQRIEARRATSAVNRSTPARRRISTQVRTLLSGLRAVVTMRVFDRMGRIARRGEAGSEA